MSDMVQCFSCSAMEQGVAGSALPQGWDALRVPGYEPSFFCAACVDQGSMEEYRAQQGLPRRASWRFPGGIMAVLRPAARQVLLATPDGMADIGEREAELLNAAIGAALETRSLAGRLMAEAAHEG